MSELSVAIMAHPQRRRFVEQLQQQLPGVEVTWDQANDRWDTGRRALLAHDPASTWHLVVQDDAVLCRDFLAGAELVASAAGANRPVALYLGSVRPFQQTILPAVREARRRGIPWIETNGPWWGVAIIIPTAHIPALLEWCDERRDIANYDKRISRYYGSRGIDCWYTQPSLVDHRRVAENPSLIRGRRGDRQAHYFIGERSPLEIDWRRTPLHVALGRLAVTAERRQTVRTRPRITAIQLGDRMEFRSTSPRLRISFPRLQLTVRFTNGVYRTSDPVAIRALQRSALMRNGTVRIADEDPGAAAPQTRKQLNERALAAGVQAPERLASKQAVLDAIDTLESVPAA